MPRFGHGVTVVPTDHPSATVIMLSAASHMYGARAIIGSAILPGAHSKWHTTLPPPLAVLACRCPRQTAQSVAAKYVSGWSVHRISVILPFMLSVSGVQLCWALVIENSLSSTAKLDVLQSALYRDIVVQWFGIRARFLQHVLLIVISRATGIDAFAMLVVLPLSKFKPPCQPMPAKVTKPAQQSVPSVHPNALHPEILLL